MIPDVPPPRRSFLRLVALLGAAAAGLFLLKVQLGSRTALSELRSEASRLKDELASRDEALGKLQDDLRRFRQELAVQQDRPARDPRVDALDAKLHELAELQSNLVVGLEAVAGSVDGLKFQMGGPGAPTPERRALSIELLRGLLAERVAERLELQQGLVDQAAELDLPPEIQALTPDQAVKVPAYREYWPYFQLMEEYDQTKRLEEALRLRIEQEVVEAKLTLDLR